MMDYRNLEQRLSDALHLQRRPVAMTFRETPPAGVPHMVVPGKDVARVADEVQIITEANAKLSEYHCGRRQALATE